METIKFGLFLALFAICFAQTTPPLITKKPVKRSYVCPPRFLIQGHRCYYYSKIKMSWNDAHFTCRDLHSNLAIIRSKFQNKLVTKNLMRAKDLNDRWLGAKYDWLTKEWRWAASGHKLTFQNFYTNDTNLGKENLKWNCLYLDPSLKYKWNADMCHKQKHFICHTKIKLVSNKGKKKLLRQYNVDKFNKLNEIPVPFGTNDTLTYKTDLNADFAFKPKPHKRRSKKWDRRKNLEGIQMTEQRYDNGTGSISFDIPQYKEYNLETKRNRRKNMDETVEANNAMKRMKWKSYYKDAKNPLYPRTNIQEYTFSKE